MLKKFKIFQITEMGIKILLLIMTLSKRGETLQYDKITRENMPGAKYYDGKKIVLPISEKSMEEIFDRWMQQAMSGILTGFSIKKSILSIYGTSFIIEILF